MERWDEAMTDRPDNPFSRKPGDPFHIPEKLGEMVRLGFAGIAPPMLLAGLLMGPHGAEDLVLMAGFAAIAAVCLYDGLSMRRTRLAREAEVEALRESLFREE
jgi:hypothetical protein